MALMIWYEWGYLEEQKEKKNANEICTTLKSFYNLYLKI